MKFPLYIKDTNVFFGSNEIPFSQSNIWADISDFPEYHYGVFWDINPISLNIKLISVNIDPSLTGYPMLSTQSALPSWRNL